MFPKNRINILYRCLCLICYIVSIWLLNGFCTLLILFLTYCVLALCEKSFRNIELIITTIILLVMCYLINNYLLFKIMLIIDYCFYFLDTSYYFDEEKEVIVSKNDYIRFNKVNKRKKGSNNITTIYVTVHLVILFIAIVVGK